MAEYADFSDVFLKKSAKVLPKHTRINKHAIKLKEDKQLPYKPIYSLGLIEPKTFKTYIETNLANRIIRLAKSPAGAAIFFVCKLDGNFCLCVNYWGLNNLTIYNQYPLPLFGKFLDWLGRAKRFTQLDLTSAYNQMRIKEGNK